MFTGIIQHVGRVVSVADQPAGKRLRVDVGPLFPRLVIGASVAIDGVCLTAGKLEHGQAEFDAVPETLSRSTLGQLHAGSAVNLEPAIGAGAPLDGHIVQGHVDGQAELRRIDRGGGEHRLVFSCTADLAGQMVPKGSIAIAGVSLTLVDVLKDEFSVALIPTTLSATKLANLRIAEPVNVELDIIGKYVRRYLQGLLPGGGGLNLEQLRRAGFA